MRELHVLGVSEDGATLLLGASKNATKPTHQIPLDERVRQAARGQLAVFGSDRTTSALTPKEIQARLREGATPEEVAKAAGVPVARVLPFFVPVEAERTRIVDQARAATMHRQRGPAATTPLGQAVDTHLQEVTGLKPESVVWTARRRADGAWVVAVSYLARGRRSAEWLWQPSTRVVTPLDASASRLASDAVPAAPKRRAKPAAAKTAKPAKKAGAKNATAKKAAPAAKKAAPAAKKAAAKKAAPKRAAAPKKVAATKAVKAVKAVKATKAAPARKATRTRAAAAPAPKIVKPRRPRVVRTPVEPEEGPFFTPAVIQLPVSPLPVAEEPVVEVVPEPVERPVEEPAAAAEQPAEETAQQQGPPRKKGQRVPIPSWDDVLLGVTRDREENRRSG